MTGTFDDITGVAPAWASGNIVYAFMLDRRIGMRDFTDSDCLNRDMALFSFRSWVSSTSRMNEIAADVVAGVGSLTGWERGEFGLVTPETDLTIPAASGAGVLVAGRYTSNLRGRDFRNGKNVA